MGTTSRAGNVYPSGAPEFTPGIKVGSRYSIFSLICMFCRSTFVCCVTFSSGHCTCVVCSSIYGFWLPHWYLQISSYNTIPSICLIYLPFALFLLNKASLFWPLRVLFLFNIRILFTSLVSSKLLSQKSRATQMLQKGHAQITKETTTNGADTMAYVTQIFNND